MKFKAPEGVCSVSVGGQELAVEDGFVTTGSDTDFGPLLAPLGFVQVEDDSPAEPEPEPEPEPVPDPEQTSDAAAAGKKKK